MESSFNLHVPSGASQTVFFRADPLASSATPDIGAISGDYVHITGTTTITGFEASYRGRVITIVFDGILTLTNSGTLILPTGANITTAVGDAAMFRCESGTTWRCVEYMRYSGSSLGGITGFLSGLNTAAPNATVNVAYLLATGGSTDKDVAIIPTGTGGFMLATPDNTATGGNKRGFQAVDLQLVRNAASQVAAGSYTFAAGLGNTVDGSYSTIPGGFENSSAVSCTASVIGGGYQNTISSGEYQVISGGRSNLILAGSTAHNVIAGGYNNVITGGGTGYSAIWGGSSLTLSNANGTAGFLSGIASGGGSAMTITASNTIVFGNNNIWLANNNNTASQLHFFEPYNTTGAFPNTAHSTAFQAQAQAADITYTLPADAPTINGQALTATTAGVMSWASVSGGMTYNNVTGTTQALAVNNSYGMNNAGLVTGTLPATAAIGDEIEICGVGAGGWAIAQNASQTIVFNATTATTAGVGGSVASTDRYDTIRLRCIVANTTFLVLWAKGTLTVT